MWRLLSLSLGLKGGAAFGLPFVVHPSWLLFWALVAYLTAVEVAPAAFPEQEPPQRWLRAMLLNALMFASVVLHEAAHLVVALRSRLSVRRLVLFPFGAVTRWGKGRLSPRAQLLLAGAGPFASLVTGIILLVAAPPWAQPLATWLGFFNLALAAANLLPAAPLDGARLLRVVGRQRGVSPFRLARFSFRAGTYLSIALVWLGLLLVGIGAPVAGLLLILFGCLFELAGNVYLVTENPWQKQVLRRTPVADVVAGSRLLSPAQAAARSQPPPGWRTNDGAVLAVQGRPPLGRWCLPAGSSLLQALDRLDRPEAPAHLFVVDGHHIVGVCSRPDVLDYLFARKQVAPFRR